MKKPGARSAAVVTLGIAATGALFSVGEQSAGFSGAHETIRQTYAKLPLAFEPNRGQADARTAFLARGAGYRIALRPTEAMLALGVATGYACG